MVKNIIILLFMLLLIGCGDRERYEFTYKCVEEIEEDLFNVWFIETGEVLITSDEDAYFCELHSVRRI